MRETGIVALRGGPGKEDYNLFGRKMLAQLKARMKTTGQRSGWWRRVLPDGTKISVATIYGQDFIHIRAASGALIEQTGPLTIEAGLLVIGEVGEGGEEGYFPGVITLSDTLYADVDVGDLSPDWSYSGRWYGPAAGFAAPFGMLFPTAKEFANPGWVSGETYEWYPDPIQGWSTVSRTLGCAEPAPAGTAFSISGQCDANILDVYAFTTTHPACLSAAFVRRKKAMALVPPSVMTGKMRLFVQAKYGNPGSRVDLAGTPCLDNRIVEIDGRVYGCSADFTTILYTEDDYTYWVLTLEGGQVRAAPVVPSQWGLWCVAYLRQRGGALSAAERRKLEALIFAEAAVGADVVVGSVPQGSTLDFGWKANWAGDKAAVVFIELLDAEYGYRRSIVYELTFAISATSKIVSVATLQDWQDFKIANDSGLWYWSQEIGRYAYVSDVGLHPDMPAFSTAAVYCWYSPQDVLIRVSWDWEQVADGTVLLPAVPNPWGPYDPGCGGSEDVCYIPYDFKAKGACHWRRIIVDAGAATASTSVVFVGTAGYVSGNNQVVYQMHDFTVEMDASTNTVTDWGVLAAQIVTNMPLPNLGTFTDVFYDTDKQYFWRSEFYQHSCGGGVVAVVPRDDSESIYHASRGALYGTWAMRQFYNVYRYRVWYAHKIEGTLTYTKGAYVGEFCSNYPHEQLGTYAGGEAQTDIITATFVPKSAEETEIFSGRQDVVNYGANFNFPSCLGELSKFIISGNATVDSWKSWTDFFSFPDDITTAGGFVFAQQTSWGDFNWHSLNPEGETETGGFAAAELGYAKCFVGWL